MRRHRPGMLDDVVCERDLLRAQTTLLICGIDHRMACAVGVSGFQNVPSLLYHAGGAANLIVRFSIVICV